LAVDGGGARILARRSIDSPFKIQHATLTGARLVLCFESFLAVLPTPDAPLENVDLRPGSPWRIDDNWFSGLHTVFPVMTISVSSPVPARTLPCGWICEAGR
jgi:hypothetical protein